VLIHQDGRPVLSLIADCDITPCLIELDQHVVGCKASQRIWWNDEVKAVVLVADADKQALGIFQDPSGWVSSARSFAVHSLAIVPDTEQVLIRIAGCSREIREGELHSKSFMKPDLPKRGVESRNEGR